MSKNKKITFGVIAAVLIMVSFWSGMIYGKSKGTAPGGQFGAMTNGGTRGGFRNTNGGMVSGEVLNKDAESITVKDRSGGSRIIFLSDSSQILKSTTGSVSDLSVGEMVTAIGTPNADGSITAQSVQIRPTGIPYGGAMQSSQKTQ